MGHEPGEIDVIPAVRAGMDNSPISETYMIVESADSGYYLAFFFDKPTSGWVKGEYKVVLSVNSQEKLSIPFSIN